MGLYEDLKTVTLTNVLDNDPELVESIDVLGRFLARDDRGITLTGCWNYSLNNSEHRPDRVSFLVGEVFYPWHRIESIGDTYDSVDNFGEEALSVWAREKGLDAEEIRQMEKHFQHFHG
ncbi:hypothetical protein [Streptomyces sp. WAC06614]|uniref:hypothetical protein n=1 Tax=Streptomyces sp. WAC06614 TaxID=2487416 RepID=UPI000F76B304|nr:hypothetical protein [Streptomyces sp. WAC06614]RSS79408.1 hypothetical protein EF918_17440 [Streptomyces sp. WAC06614]